MNYWDKLMVITDIINDVMDDQGINKEHLSWDEIDTSKLTSRQRDFVESACKIWDYLDDLDQGLI